MFEYSNYYITSLYSAFNNEAGLTALQILLSTGALSSIKIKSAVSIGRGSSAWDKLVADLFNMIVVITNLQQFYIDCQTNPLIPIELIELRVQALGGTDSLDEESVSEPSKVNNWQVGLREEDKRQKCTLLIDLYRKTSTIIRVQESALNSMLENEKQREENENKKSSTRPI